MSDRITVTLHHLLASIDGYADELLRRDYGVSFSQFSFLAAVADSQPVDITTLARCLVVSKAAVSKRVPSLVQDGWLDASDDPHHGRRVLLSLTPRATALIESAGGRLDDEFTVLFAHPALAAAGVDVDDLHRQLTLLLDLVADPTAQNGTHEWTP